MDYSKIKKDMSYMCTLQGLETPNSVQYILDSEEDCIPNETDFRIKCDWKSFTKHIASQDSFIHNLSEDFLEYFCDDIGWYNISRSCPLSVEFIKKHADKLNWSMISQHQHLSEETIERFEKWVKWDKISLGQTHITDAFIWKYQHKLNINNVIIFNKNISQHMKEQLRDYR